MFEACLVFFEEVDFFTVDESLSFFDGLEHGEGVVDESQFAGYEAGVG